MNKRQNPNTMTVEYLTAITGRELRLTFPAKFEVCHRCRGTGTHVNPSIDGHGLSREDFEEDPDFEEAYFSGVYDVTCDTCNGERVIQVVDEDRLTARGKSRYAVWCAREDERAADEAADRRTRYMESGGMEGSWN